ncbi:ABC transporter permease subunit [candidate division KSB1 bacterium]|nr:ABC transporter permease subunit [candidate division KSB1 bacterium]
MKFLSIVQLTFRESLAKKTFIAFLIISTIINLLFLLALNLDIVDGMQSSISIFGEQTDQIINLQEIIYGVEGFVAVMLFTVGIFMALFATSGLIPTLLQPGFIDLFISKPVSRFEILSGRYLGAVAIVALNIFYLVIGTWLIMSLKTGIWNFGFLLGGALIVLTFAILFALMTLLGIVSKSGPLSLMITYLILFFSPLLKQRDSIYALLSSKIYGQIIDGLYYFLPKTSELGSITQRLTRGLEINTWTPLWTSLAFGIFIFLLSAYIFQRKNF